MREGQGIRRAKNLPARLTIRRCSVPYPRLAVDLSRFYSLDLLSVVVMGNH